MHFRGRSFTTKERLTELSNLRIDVYFFFVRCLFITPVQGLLNVTVTCSKRFRLLRLGTLCRYFTAVIESAGVEGHSHLCFLRRYELSAVHRVYLGHKPERLQDSGYLENFE